MFVFEFQGEPRSKTGAKTTDFSCETHRRCRTLQNGKSNYITICDKNAKTFRQCQILLVVTTELCTLHIYW